VIRHEVASYILNGLKESTPGFLTVTEVTVTKDLQIARIYFSIFGTVEEKATTMDVLEHSKKEIRTHLAHALNLRYVPQLEIFEDEGLETSLRVQKLLYDLQPEKVEVPVATEAADESEDDADGASESPVAVELNSASIDQTH
jgi:ribosome-binding factor A